MRKTNGILFATSLVMKRLPVKTAISTPVSGTTEMINYDPKSRVLEVQFTGGRVYRYFQVPLSVWREYKDIVASGGSSGTYVNVHIKPKFRYEEAK